MIFRINGVLSSVRADASGCMVACIEVCQWVSVTLSALEVRLRAPSPCEPWKCACVRLARASLSACMRTCLCACLRDDSPWPRSSLFTAGTGQTILFLKYGEDSTQSEPLSMFEDSDPGRSLSLSLSGLCIPRASERETVRDFERSL